jgi:hypothetical protein
VQSIPEDLLRPYLEATDELASWDVLADWVHEQGPALSPAMAPDGARFWAIDRRELTHRGFLRWAGERGPSLYALEPVLRASRSLLDELRVTADWHGPHALVFGTAPPHQPPQHRVLPTVLEAVLAAAPVALRRLEVWLPPNPPWGPQDDCLTQLAPLARQRPPSARHLTLRTPARGLLALLREVAQHRWQSIRFRAPLTSQDLAELDAIAAATAGTRFFRYGAVQGTRHVPLAPDPDEWELTLHGVACLLEPGRGLAASQFEFMLGEFDLRLDTELGLLTLDRTLAPRPGTVLVDDTPLVEARRLWPGVTRLVWTSREGARREGTLELRSATGPRR